MEYSEDIPAIGLHVPTVTDSEIVATAHLGSVGQPECQILTGGIDPLGPISIETWNDGRLWRWRFGGVPSGRQVDILLKYHGRTVRRPIQTMPTPSGPRRVRWAHLPDTHFCTGRAPKKGRLRDRSEEVLLKTLDDLRGLEVEWLVITGDIVDGAGSRDDAVAAKRALDGCGIPYAVVPGNHDLEVRQTRQWCKTWGRRRSYYAEERDGIRWLMLDTARGDLSDAQHEWLGKQLEKDRNVPTCLCTHWPVMLRDGELESSFPSSEYLLEKIAIHPHVIAIYGGHKHWTAHIVRKAVHQVVSGEITIYPCTYTVIDVHDSGWWHHTRQIGDLSLVEQSYDDIGDGTTEKWLAGRWGDANDRSFVIPTRPPGNV